MSGKKKFLLRLDERVYASLERWAADDLRSVNSQIEFLLTNAVRRAGRYFPKEASPPQEERSIDGIPPEATEEELV